MTKKLNVHSKKYPIFRCVCFKPVISHHTNLPDNQELRYTVKRLKPRRTICMWWMLKFSKLQYAYSRKRLVNPSPFYESSAFSAGFQWILTTLFQWISTTYYYMLPIKLLPQYTVTCKDRVYNVVCILVNWSGIKCFSNDMLYHFNYNLNFLKKGTFSKSRRTGYKFPLPQFYNILSHFVLISRTMHIVLASSPSKKHSL